MVKATNWTKKGTNLYSVEVMADSRDEVEDGAPIQGLPKGYEMEIGSSCMTVNGDIAFLDSEGHWNWVGDE